MRIRHLLGLVLLATLAGCTRTHPGPIEEPEYPPRHAAPRGAEWRLAAPDGLALVTEALQQADVIHVLSLSPYPAATPAERFHEWPVLGTVAVTDPRTLSRVTAALQVQQAVGLTTCFWPRHGIRMNLRGQPLDLVICFECLQVQAHHGVRDLGVFQPAHAAEALLNGLLDQASVKRAPPA